MRLCLQLGLIIATLLQVSGTNAQTLDKVLIGEDPAKLAELARKDGDVVRGAILFHQGNINCAKCHRPTAERDRIGPDLSRMDREVTDASIVESILQPSKTIKQGFETVTALTLDGRLLSGIVVKEDDKEIILRDSENVDRLITIRRDELDQVRPGLEIEHAGRVGQRIKKPGTVSRSDSIRFRDQRPRSSRRRCGRQSCCSSTTQSGAGWIGLDPGIELHRVPPISRDRIVRQREASSQFEMVQ